MSVVPGRVPRIVAPMVAAGAVAAVLVAVVTALGAGPGTGPPLGATLGERDRTALAAPAVGRGTPAPDPDPGLDLTDAEAVARAYLVAAHGAVPEDAGHTHLRAAPYAVPGTSPATVGVLVLDPPPTGTRRLARVESLELAAADRADRRRGYAAAVTTAVVPGGPAVTTDRYLVLARHDGDRWRVAAETPWSPDLPAGDG